MVLNSVWHDTCHLFSAPELVGFTIMALTSQLPGTVLLLAISQSLTTLLANVTSCGMTLTLGLFLGAQVSAQMGLVWMARWADLQERKAFRNHMLMQHWQATRPTLCLPRCPCVLLKTNVG